MSPVARRLAASWYGDTPPPLWTRALEPLYRRAICLRRAAYQRGWLRSGHPGRPVIVVGNLTAGGAGKTPLVIWLTRALAARGLAPAVVSRGYGGAEPAAPHKVSLGEDPDFCGDEPLLIAADTGAPVWICRDRLAAARAAVAAGAGVVVSDDGLQHYGLARDVEILVVDGQRGLGNGRCLPAGPLREPAGRLGEVDLVVCNGKGRCPAKAVVMTLEGDAAVRLDASARASLASFAPGPVHAIAGIGNPERFFAMLESHGLALIRHPLPDHGAVPAELLAPADGMPVMMTSKDAARCARHPLAGTAWQVPVQARLADEGARLFDVLARRGAVRRE